MNRIFILSILLLTTITAHAQVPDIGDNSFFYCSEIEDNLEPGMCYGDIRWATDKRGESKEGKSLRLKKARKLLSNAKKFFSKQKRKAERIGDTEAAEDYEAKKQNILTSRDDIFTCYDYYESCGGQNFPSLQVACNIVTEPNTYGALNRTTSNYQRIVNGRVCSETAAANSPVVKITYFGDLYCTGTLVAPNTVLTAAHCIEGIDCRDLSVRNSVGSQIIGVSDCLAHPKYNKRKLPQANDVAILFIPNEFDGITPAELVTSSASVGDDAVLVGYGYNEDDDTNLRATFNSISRVKTEVISTLYKVGDENQGTTCNGDSGGPLFVFSAGKWKTHGTLSDGSAADCALPGTSPNTDKSNWANLLSPSNQEFIRDNTEGVLD